MLGLAQQVDRGEERIGGVVGDHQRLGRPGEQVDADLAEQLALGLGDVRVAGPGQHVDAADRLGAERQRGHGLHAAEDVDLVRAGQVHGGDRGVRHGAADRRRARGDTRDAGDLRGDDRHVRGRHQRVAAARHVGTGGLHRHVAVPEDRRPAGSPPRTSRSDSRWALGEVAHVALDEHDVLEHLRADLGEDLRSISSGLEPERRRRPAVEALGVDAHRLVAALADVGDDRRHPLGHPFVGASRGRGGRSRLQRSSCRLLFDQGDRARRTAVASAELQREAGEREAACRRAGRGWRGSRSA